MKKPKQFHIYRAKVISRASINSSGIRWNCLTSYGFLRSNTLAGIKQLIRAQLKRVEGARAPSRNNGEAEFMQTTLLTYQGQTYAVRTDWLRCAIAWGLIDLSQIGQAWPCSDYQHEQCVIHPTPTLRTSPRLPA